MCWFLKLCQTCISIIATNHTSRSCSNSIVPPRKFLQINRPEKKTQVYSSFNLKTKMPKYQIYLSFSGRSLEIFVDERLNESQNTRLTPATSANSDDHTTCRLQVYVIYHVCQTSPYIVQNVLNTSILLRHFQGTFAITSNKRVLFC